MPIVRLNMAAGKKAMDSFRHKTAYSYLEAAFSLLPDDCWESHYEISLRLGFMMASAANSSCKYDVAESVLKRILKEAHCTEDKLPSYFLLSQSKFIFSCCFYSCSSRLSATSELTHHVAFFSPPSTGQSSRCVQHMLFYLNSTRGDRP